MVDQMETPLYSMLSKLRSELERSRHRLVLAESCTSGLVAAELGQIPGISEFFCGSMVVYQTATKNAWLSISTDILEAPQLGPVSAEVTEQLLSAILDRTPQATIAGAITGHLGPKAPESMDGLIYCGFLEKNPGNGKLGAVRMKKQFLVSPPPEHANDFARRRTRQREATLCLLEWIVEHLEKQRQTAIDGRPSIL